MKKAFVVTSVASMIDQFNIPVIKLLQELGYDVVVGCNFEKGSSCTDVQINRLKSILSSLNVKFYQIDFDRSLFHLSGHFKAYKEIKNILETENFDLIHCQSPMGGILTRMAAKRSENTEIIYTAHGFHFYKGAPLKNWLLFYPLEKHFSKLTDKLITINIDDFILAKEKMKAKKIYYVKGIGVDTKFFRDYILTDEAKAELYKELGIDSSKKIVLSVGELNDNKNHKIVINALSKLKDNNFHYVIAGKGVNANELTKLAKDNGVNLHLIGFRDDLVKWYKLCDLFVLPSYREGLAVSLMEALASNAKVLASDIRGNRDIVKKECLFNPSNADELSRLIKDYINQDRVYENVFDFDIDCVLKDMKDIYLDK